MLKAFETGPICALGILVSHSDEVIGELLYCSGSLSWLYIFLVMGDEEGLLGLDDDNPFFALPRR